MGQKSSLYVALSGTLVTGYVLAAPPSPSVEVTVSGPGGVVSEPAAIDCREDSGVCTSTFAKGSTVVLTANSDSDSTFVRWEGECVGSETTCSLKLKGGTKVVTAVFEGISVSYPAPAQSTGQVSCWDSAGYEVACAGTGHDGDVLAGVKAPYPRFSDNGDGTLLDNLTGLIWLKYGNCINSNYPELSGDSGKVTWQMALDFVAGMNSGTYYCGSDATDWRLPNVRELHSLIDYEKVWRSEAVPPSPFVNAASIYWSSTSGNNVSANSAFHVNLAYGQIQRTQKDSPYNWVIAVRGGK
jgi:hypothetical protein